jgi:hypothetical protein
VKISTAILGRTRTTAYLTKIRSEEEQAKHHKMETIYDDKTMYRAGHKLAEEITIMAIQGLDGEWQGILPG